MYLQTDSFVIEDEELKIIRDALSEYQCEQEIRSDLWIKIKKILSDIGEIQDKGYINNYDSVHKDHL